MHTQMQDIGLCRFQLGGHARHAFKFNAFFCSGAPGRAPVLRTPTFLLHLSDVLRASGKLCSIKGWKKPGTLMLART